MYKIPELEEIRKDIDRLDNNIHDLLMERASLIDKIGQAKKEAGVQIVQPAREARMIRRLLSRHEGPLPEEAIVSIWRELVGAVCMMQTGLKFSVFSTKDNFEYMDMARDYFGGVLPMFRSDTIYSTLALLRNGSVNFAVLPWPELDTPKNRDCWWSPMLDDGNDNMNIVVSLPYGNKFNDVKNKALVIGRDMKFSTSDNDNSFVGIEISGNYSRSGMMDKIRQCGLNPLSAYATEDDGTNIRRFLIEIQGYIAENDDILEKIKEVLTVDGNKELKVKSLGGYPIPLQYKGR